MGSEISDEDILNIKELADQVSLNEILLADVDFYWSMILNGISNLPLP